MITDNISKVNEYLTDGEYTDPSILEAFNEICKDALRLETFKTAEVGVEVEYSTDDAGNQSQLYIVYVYIPQAEDVVKRIVIGRVKTVEDAGIAKAALITMFHLL